MLGDLRSDWIRVVQSSPRLQQYRREVYARHSRALAQVLRAENPNLDVVTASSLARAMVGVLESALESVGQRILDGQPPRRALRLVRAEAERAFRALGEGLVGFGIR